MTKYTVCIECIVTKEMTIEEDFVKTEQDAREYASEIFHPLCEEGVPEKYDEQVLWIRKED